MSASPARSDAGVDNSNLNLTRPLAPSPGAAALFGANAALQVEGLRALLCEKPLQPSRPAHVKAYANPDDITESEWGDVHCASAVVESRMFMADQLLSLVYRASAGPHPTHFHQEWDRQLLFGSSGGGAAEIKDVVVPLDNIVRPLSADDVIFPVCDDDDGNNNSGDGARSAVSLPPSPVLLRHAAQIPPSAGRVEGDWSQRVHDSSVPSLQQTDAQSPRRLRIARSAPDEFAQDKRGDSDSDGDNNTNGGSSAAQAAAEASAKRELAAIAPPSTAGESSSASRLRNAGGGAAPAVMSNLLLGGRPAGLKDVERKQRSAEMHQLSAEERAKLVCRREAQKSRARPVIYLWRLSTVAVAGGASSIVALAAAPISATAVHRCSIQILSHANVDGVDAVPAGTTALANGAFFDRPAACFGLANRQVLASAAHAAKPELWNALCWKSSGTMPAAAMMSAVSATGMPQLELPRFGREHNGREHYVKIGDVLTIETRPVIASSSSSSPSGGSSSYINQFLNNSNSNNGAGGKQQLAGVSLSFYINNVLVHSYDNIARLQPYSKAASAGAATLTALPHPSQQLQQQQNGGSSGSFLQQGLERSPFCVDFMYFAVRLWPGTEVAIVSGDTNRILEPAAAQTTRVSIQ